MEKISRKKPWPLHALSRYLILQKKEMLWGKLKYWSEVRFDYLPYTCTCQQTWGLQLIILHFSCVNSKTWRYLVFPLLSFCNSLDATFVHWTLECFENDDTPVLHLSLHFISDQGIHSIILDSKTKSSIQAKVQGQSRKSCKSSMLQKFCKIFSCQIIGLNNIYFNIKHFIILFEAISCKITVKSLSNY